MAIEFAEELVRSYTFARVTEILAISRQTLIKWVSEGRFPGAARSGEGQTDPWMFPAADVERARLARLDDLDEKIDELQRRRERVAAAVVEVE
jgi:predicted site-specific integrase-resolvase